MVSCRSLVTFQELWNGLLLNSNCFNQPQANQPKQNQTLRMAKSSEKTAYKIFCKTQTAEVEFLSLEWTERLEPRINHSTRSMSTIHFRANITKTRNGDWRNEEWTFFNIFKKDVNFLTSFFLGKKHIKKLTKRFLDVFITQLANSCALLVWREHAPNLNICTACNYMMTRPRLYAREVEDFWLLEKWLKTTMKNFSIFL